MERGEFGPPSNEIFVSQSSFNVPCVRELSRYDDKFLFNDLFVTQTLIDKFRFQTVSRSESLSLGPDLFQISPQALSY